MLGFNVDFNTLFEQHPSIEASSRPLHDGPSWAPLLVVVFQRWTKHLVFLSTFFSPIFPVSYLLLDCTGSPWMAESVWYVL